MSLRVAYGHPQGPTPPADYAPSLRSPWRAASDGGFQYRYHPSLLWRLTVRLRGAGHRRTMARTRLDNLGETCAKFNTFPNPEKLFPSIVLPRAGNTVTAFGGTNLTPPLPIP